MHSNVKTTSMFYRALFVLDIELFDDVFVFFLNWTFPVSFYLLLVFFNQTLQFLSQINVKNIHQVWCMYSNLQPLDHVSSPITSRPVSRLIYLCFFASVYNYPFKVRVLQWSIL